MHVSGTWVLADRTREHLWRELGGENVSGAGAHSPERRFGRVLEGKGRRWWTLTHPGPGPAGGLSPPER